MKTFFNSTIPFLPVLAACAAGPLVTAVHDAKGGWKFFRDGADAPFAEMA